MSKLIAVTGSKGFIGSALCKALRAAGHNVIECDLLPCDITNPLTLDRLENAEILYHLAAMPLINCKENKPGCVETNVLGTVNVLEAARNVRRVIYASASSIYGNAPLPVKEDAEPKPVTLYGATKYAAEHFIRLYSQDYGFSHVIFRLTNVYGPGQRYGLIPSVIDSILNGKPITVKGDGRQTRDFVYVEDVVNILTQAISHPLYSCTVNLGTGVETSVCEIINLCVKYLGKPALLRYVMFDNDRLRFCADNTLLRKLYNPTFTPVAEGLRRTIDLIKATQEV